MEVDDFSKSILGEQRLIRGYHRNSKAWYSKIPALQGSNADISFGVYGLTGNPIREMKIEWIPAREGISPQIRACEKGWVLFE
ncbi:MAG: hypothetical protein JNJ47_06700, partial [Alphaproteobacteria bacterium]|nr:hypothetical protein [Alphaproteobacteria bacterium]